MCNRCKSLNKVILIVFTMLLAILLSACVVKKGNIDSSDGELGNPKNVEIDVSDDGLNLIETAAPSADYAFYVSLDSIPQSLEEIQEFDVRFCTGLSEEYRVDRITEGIGTTRMFTNLNSGSNDRDCIKELLKEPKTLVLTLRSIKPPSDAIEVIFK